MLQRQAELTQSILSESQLNESIRTEIANALRNQLELIDELYFAGQAVDWYSTALSDEIARLKQGYSSLFIVIDYEKSLRQTTIEKVLVESNYAENIVELLFQTGTLVNYDKCTDGVNIEIMNYEKLLKKLSEN